MPRRVASARSRRAASVPADDGIAVLPVDGATLRALQLDVRNIEVLGRGLQAALWDHVRAEWPMDLARWPLISQRVMVRTYLTNRPLPPRDGDAAAGVRIVPAGGVVLAMDVLPGVGSSMSAELRWLLVDLPGAPTNADAHRELRGYAAVGDEGAAFALPLSALRTAEGAITNPVVRAQVVLNAEHHRALLDGGSKAASRGRRADGLPLDEANVRAREILQRRPDITARELADAIPCSIGQVPRLSAWRAVVERRAKEAPPRSVRATALEAELLELMADQRTEMEADERLPARRVARQRKKLSD